MLNTTHGRGLSALQRQLLVTIYEANLTDTVHTMQVHPRHLVGIWMVEWRPLVGSARSRVEHASTSRALRRLEARGLIDRYNGRGRRRTTSVRVTPAGITVAERLTQQQNRWLLTVGAMQVEPTDEECRAASKLLNTHERHVR